MKTLAPAKDQATASLPMLDEVLDLARELEANWSAVVHPPGTLLNEAEPGSGPAAVVPPAEPAEPGQPAEDPAFAEPDLSQIPEDPEEARAFIARRYEEMNRDYTQKTQSVAERQREAEDNAALINGLRDPNSLPHYMRLLGVDLTDPEILSAFGLEMDAPGAGLDDLDLNEPDLESEINQLKQERAEERQAAAANAELLALDDFADDALEEIEGQWGRKLNEEEDVFLRFQAESNPLPNGAPDYESAAKTLKRLLDKQVEDELKRRQEPGAGRGGPGGIPGGKAPDTSTEEGRLAVAAAAAERAMASQT